MKILKIIFSILVIVTLFVFFLQIIEKLDYKNNNLGIIICIILIIEIIIILKILLMKFKYKKYIFNKIISIFIVILFISIFLLEILNIFIKIIEEPWRTQMTIAKNKNINNYFIEFQMQDIGILGYRNRIVAVYYLNKNIMIINKIILENKFLSEFDKKDIKNIENWEVINLDVNELDFDSGW